MDELRKRVSTSALHDTSTRQGDETTECHPKTRQRLLAELMDMPSGREKLVNWLYGPAGAGKTAIMRSLAALFEQQDRLLAGFHFWRSDLSRNTLKNFVATIVFQLALKEPAAFPLIKKALEQDALLLDKSRKTQMEKLIIEPLLACSANDSAQKTRCIVIDGLDECDEAGQREFLEQLLPTLVSRLSSIGISFFVASRPETTIENLFTHPRLRTVTDRILLEPSPQDVREYLDAEFEEISRCYPRLEEQYGGKWPSDQQRDRLVDKSSGYFILCATAIRHINPPYLRGRPPDQRLGDVLDAVSTDSLRPLDALYHFILRQNAPESPALLDEWKRAIGLVCMPIDITDSTFAMGYNWRVFRDRKDTIDILLLFWYGKGRPSLEHLFTGLGSLIYFDKQTRQPKPYHASLADFLFNVHRSQEFFVDAGVLHLELICLIVKVLNHDENLSSYMLSHLLKENFPYHLDRAPLDRVADIGKAFDDISWSSRAFSSWSTIENPLDGFTDSIHFFASLYSAFELFLELSDLPNAPAQRQRMLFNLSPFVNALLEDVTRCMDGRFSIHGRELEFLIKLWGVISLGSGPTIANPRHSLLHFHSTNCLLLWTFDADSRAVFPCARQICLDERELLNRPHAFHKDSGALAWSLEDAALIPDNFNLLKAIGSTGMIGGLLSHFFDKFFPLRCARILYNHLTPLSTPGDCDEDSDDGSDSDSDEDNNYLDSLPRFFWVYSAVYFIHSVALLKTLDALWQMMFLHDVGRSYIDKWHPTCSSWHNSTSPKDTFLVKQILQYLNRCLRKGLVPTAVPKIRGAVFHVNAWVRKERVVNLSAEQQQQMWAKYSALVLDDPSFPQVADVQPTPVSVQPESRLATLASDDLPLTVDRLLHSTGFAQPDDSLGLTSMSESSGFKRPFNDPEEPEETCPTPQVVKKKKVSFWKALAPGR